MCISGFYLTGKVDKKAFKKVCQCMGVATGKQNVSEKCHLYYHVSATNSEILKAEA